MHKRIATLGAAILGFATIQTIGCGDSSGPAEPATRGLEVRVTTFGQNIDLDPDGYTLVVDGLPAGAIGINNAMTIDRLPLGTHSVKLQALAPNCVVLGGELHSVNVTKGKLPSQLSLQVSCAPLLPGVLGPWDY